MDGKKTISTSNKDIHLALKTLRKVTTDMERSASNNLTIIIRKKKRVQEEYAFYLSNTQCEIAH